MQRLVKSGGSIGKVSGGGGGAEQVRQKAAGHAGLRPSGPGPVSVGGYRAGLDRASWGCRATPGRVDSEVMAAVARGRDGGG